MKNALLFALILGVASIGMAPSIADAKRMGGGGSSGMQRSLPSRPAPSAPPAKPAEAPASAKPAPTTPATPAAAAPKRSWMGPLAGLAAGLGIAALMSHLGLGAEFANIIMIVLLALVAIVVVRFLLRRFGPSARTESPQAMQFAAAGSPARPVTSGSGWTQPTAPSSGAVPETTTRLTLPPDFDRAAFERIAKTIFIRMQAAHDAGDLNDLRSFTTPEMFAPIKLDLQDRAGKSQQTDVVDVDAEVLDLAVEGSNQIVSVRFHGLIREEQGAAAAPFNEVWHLVKPADGTRGWAVAGIQQMA